MVGTLVALNLAILLSRESGDSESVGNMFSVLPFLGEGRLRFR